MKKLQIIMAFKTLLFKNKLWVRRVQFPPRNEVVFVFHKFAFMNVEFGKESNQTDEVKCF